MVQKPNCVTPSAGVETSSTSLSPISRMVVSRYLALS